MLIKKAFDLSARDMLVETKVSSEVVDQLEKILKSYDDKPSAFEPKLRKRNTRGRRGRSGKYEGRTPRTNMTRRHPFDQTIENHDMAARTSGQDYGLFGPVPFR